MTDARASSTARLIATAVVCACRDPHLAPLLPPLAAETSAWFLSQRALRMLQRDWVRALLRAAERLTLPGIVLHYVQRKRCLEEIARSGLRDGLTQVAVLGAGFDTLALRLHREFPEVRFVEIDHPATQRAKRRALEAHGLPDPNLELLPADFTRGLRLSLPEADTLFLAEGVLMYLSPEAVSDVFDFVRGAGRRYRRFAFSFLEPQPDGRISFRRPNRAVDLWLRLRSEPLRWGIRRDALPGWLRARGFSLSRIIASPLGEYVCVAECGAIDESACSRRPRPSNCWSGSAPATPQPGSRGVSVGFHVGLDIGAVSVKLAVLGSPEDRDVLAAACDGSRNFRLFEGRAADGRPMCLLLSACRRLAGNPRQSTFDLLRDLCGTVPESSIRGIRVTGSGGRTIADVLGVRFENEFKAVIRMIGAFYPQTRTVFEIGGESSKYIRLEEEGETGRPAIVDYDRSGECAAGTGSFLDQQALRLGYSVQEIGDLVTTAHRTARIAGRCSVFAKSDMIHAQQKGFSPAEILRGLCDAVARNFKSSVVKGRPVIPPVVLVGAVSQNAGVTAALREVFRLGEADLIVPELYAWGGAIGAAMLEAEESQHLPSPDIRRLCVPNLPQSERNSRPLSMEKVILLRERITPYRPPPGAPIPAYLGIDVGSVSTNVVAIDECGAVIHDVYLRTAGRPIEAVQQGLAEVERLWGSRLRIQAVGATGSGRELIAEFVGADVVNDEITAHKTGALSVSDTLGGERVDTIFEIGGQDSKFISIENGVVVDFAMNEACAAGTGSFLEEQAERLGVSIKDEFARLALSAPAPAPLGERCTVFMDREVTARLHEGESAPSLAAGLAYSIALNYLNRVVRGKHIGNVIYFQGGTAYNDAVAAAFAALLGKRITVPPYNGVIGAIGMALIARQWRLSTGHPSRFRGYDLKRLRVTSRDFVCRACSNLCEVKQFIIEGQKSYWGDKCSDKFRKPCLTGRQPVIEDLFALRERLLHELTSQPARAPGQICVGVPRAMSIHERYPFWHRYFTALGMHVVQSPPTDPKIAADGVELALAQPCFPVQVAHGHVQALIEMGVDYVLVPNVLDAESEESSCVAHQCPWNQTLPWVLRSSLRLEPYQHLFLTPTLHFQLGCKQVKPALAALASRLGVTRQASNRAVEEAYAAQQEFQSRLLAAGCSALNALDRTGEPGVLLVGRSYNIYDGSINCDIPCKLRHHYGVNVIPLDFLVTGREPMAGLHENMYWSSGRKILAAARLAASRSNLHIIYVSNFKCGPDSYLKYFARQTAAVPLLVLQFDGHGNDAGYLTRCEAYLDSKGVLRCLAPKPTEPVTTAGV